MRPSAGPPSWEQAGAWSRMPRQWLESITANRAVWQSKLFMRHFVKHTCTIVSLCMQSHNFVILFAAINCVTLFTFTQLYHFVCSHTHIQFRQKILVYAIYLFLAQLPLICLASCIHYDKNRFPFSSEQNFVKSVPLIDLVLIYSVICNLYLKTQLEFKDIVPVDNMFVSLNSPKT